jgi:hypothetical protein
VYGHTVEIMGQVAGDLARTSRGGHQGFSKNRRFFKLWPIDIIQLQESETLLVQAIANLG